MLINEQDVMLETRVQMWFEAKLDNNRIVVAVNVGVYTVETLEDVSEERWESFGKGDTDPTREHLLIIDIALDPGHEMLNVLGCGHLGGLLVVLGVLP
jgi:hypothetical protein